MGVCVPALAFVLFLWVKITCLWGDANVYEERVRGSHFGTVETLLRDSFPGIHCFLGLE